MFPLAGIEMISVSPKRGVQPCHQLNKTQDKHMYTLAEVEPLIIDEWHIWSQANNSRQGVDMCLFYGYLQTEKSIFYHSVATAINVSAFTTGFKIMKTSGLGFVASDTDASNKRVGARRASISPLQLRRHPANPILNVHHAMRRRLK
jgi:hypothetical protein